MKDARVNFGASKITIVGKRLSPAEIDRLGAFDDIRVAQGDEDEPRFWTRNRQVRMRISYCESIRYPVWCGK